jgi:hypothetical protein
MSCDETPFPTIFKTRSNKNRANLNEGKTAKTSIDQQKEEFLEHEELRTEAMK